MGVAHSHTVRSQSAPGRVGGQRRQDDAEPPRVRRIDVSSFALRLNFAWKVWRPMAPRRRQEHDLLHLFRAVNG